MFPPVGEPCAERGCKSLFSKNGVMKIGLKDGCGQGPGKEGCGPLLMNAQELLQNSSCASQHLRRIK